MVGVFSEGGEVLGSQWPRVWCWHLLRCLWYTRSCEALPLVPKTSRAWAQPPPAGPRCCSAPRSPVRLTNLTQGRARSEQSSFAHFCPAGPVHGVGASKCLWNRIEFSKYLLTGLCFLHFSNVGGSWRGAGSTDRRPTHGRRMPPWPLSAPVVPWSLREREPRPP